MSVIIKCSGSVQNILVKGKGNIYEGGIMFRPEIKVVDCTVRDGGLMNKW